MSYLLFNRSFRQILSQPVYLCVWMVIIVQLIFQKLSCILIYLCLKLFIWWKFKVIIEFWWCELSSFGDKLSFKVWEQTKFLLNFLQWRLIFVGLKESFFVIIFNEGYNSVGLLNFLVYAFVLIGSYYIITLFWKGLDGRNVKLSDLS